MHQVRNYIGGAWVEAEASGALDVENPSTGAILARVPLSTPAEVDRAVRAAAAAFPAWSQTPASRRVRPLFALVERLRQDETRLARQLVAEMGKSLPDARAEIKRLFENLEAACGMPLLQQGDKMIGCAQGIDGEVIRQPLGVFGMIAPFNFPAMVPFWFLPYAIASGNTFVVKTSELVPLTMELIISHLAEVDLPPGVVNVVNGDKVAGQALIAHPLVKGISLVGTTATCRVIAEQCARLGKRCQAMGGAKNHLIAMPDAKVDDMVRNMVSSCYGCAGQRCMASSVIVAVGEDMHRTACARFIEESKKVVVADPLDPRYADHPMLMGPVISAKAKANILHLIDTGISEGATLALDGRQCVVPGCERGHFIGPTVFTGVRPGMTIHRTEVFGPVVCLLKAASLDEAIAIINDGEYGNGASIYTQNGHWARKFKLEVEAGMLGINVGIPAPVAFLPFGGMKASFLSDIKTQGRSAIDFYTTEKIITERYWPEA